MTPATKIRILFIGLTLLLTDWSGLRGVNRPVGDQGKRRPGSTDFGDLVHHTFLNPIVLASQAGNSGRGVFPGFGVEVGDGGEHDDLAGGSKHGVRWQSEARTATPLWIDLSRSAGRGWCLPSCRVNGMGDVATW